MGWGSRRYGLLRSRRYFRRYDVYRRALLPGAATGITRFRSQNERAVYPGFPATHLADFWLIRVRFTMQREVDVARRAHREAGGRVTELALPLLF